MTHFTSARCFQCGEKISQESSYSCNDCKEDVCCENNCLKAHKNWHKNGEPEDDYEDPEESIHKDQK